ncbi:MAG: GntR family transcriptional regulator [Caulobacterales bacterium]|nr:GntR family transcriptional regulator [Caulobacterales bacterium]
MAEIVAGGYRPGDRIPTERQLIQAHCTSITTVRRAISELCASGWLVKQQGSGTFVTEKLVEVGLVFPYPSAEWGSAIEQMSRHLLENRAELRPYFYEWTDPSAFLQRLLTASSRSQGCIIFPPYGTGAGSDSLAVPAAAPYQPRIWLEQQPGQPKETLIAVDYRAAFGELCAALGRNGRQAAALVDVGHPTATGLHDACMASGIAKERVVSGSFQGSREAVARAIEGLLRLRPTPDAVICPSSGILLKTHAVLRSLGIRVPDTIELAAAGELAVLASLAVPLWAIALPRRDLAQAAAAQFLAQLRGTPRQAVVAVPGRLVYLEGGGVFERRPSLAPSG